MYVDERREPTEGDLRLFRAIAQDIRSNLDKYRAAGAWLDEYCSDEGYWQRLEKRVNDAKQGKPPQLYNLFADAYHFLIKTCRGRVCISEEDARRILLITWLLTDPKAGSLNAHITRLQTWAWESATDMPGSRSNASRMWAGPLYYGPWMRLTRLAWEQAGGTQSPDVGTRPASILGETIPVCGVPINWRPLLVKLKGRKKTVLIVLLLVIVGACSTAKWWFPLVLRAVRKGTTDTSSEATTYGQLSPVIVTGGPNSPVTVNYGSPDNPRVSLSSESLLRSLRDICADIDARPLLQRDDTTKHYAGFAVKREPLSLVEIGGEDETFLLLMIFPGGPYVPFSGGWGISCRLRKDAYPELAGAKRGLQVHVSGVVQEVTGNSVMLENASIELDQE